MDVEILENANRVWSDSDRARVRNLMLNGASKAHIAEIMGRTEKAIEQCASRMGLGFSGGYATGKAPGTRPDLQGKRKEYGLAPDDPGKDSGEAAKQWRGAAIASFQHVKDLARVYGKENIGVYKSPCTALPQRVTSIAEARSWFGSPAAACAD